LVRKGYRNLSIPEELYKSIEDFVKKSKGRYVSVAEVMREAIREFLEKQHEDRQSR
jgi:Arc/MetJ-type ribon-helix-helix transcriptional regulator